MKKRHRNSVDDLQRESRSWQSCAPHEYPATPQLHPNTSRATLKNALHQYRQSGMYVHNPCIHQVYPSQSFHLRTKTMSGQKQQQSKRCSKQFYVRTSLIVTLSSLSMWKFSSFPFSERYWFFNMAWHFRGAFGRRADGLNVFVLASPHMFRISVCKS